MSSHPVKRGQYLTMIAAEFQLTSDDYTEAQFSHSNRIFGKTFVSGILLLSPALALVVTMLIYYMDPAKGSRLVPLWIFLGALLLLMILLRSGALYRIRFNRIKALHEPIHFEAGDSGVVYRTSRSESKIKWEGFERWRESEGSFLLYLQPRAFLLVPKRVLKTEQVTALRELLRSRIG
jgi:hypothetical protein